MGDRLDKLAAWFNQPLWRRRPRPGPRPTAAVVERLVTLAGQAPGEAVAGLSDLVASEPETALCLLVEPSRLARLAAALATVRLEWAQYPDWLGADYSQSVETLRLFDDLFRRLGGAALPTLRPLLTGPPSGSTVFNLSLSGLPALLEQIVGVKATALAVVGRWGDEDDRPAIERLAGDPAEDPFTRLAAFLALGELGLDVAERLVEEACRAVLPSTMSWHLEFDTYAPFAARLGAPLIGPCVTRLSHPDYTVRHRSMLLLAALGEVAVPTLTELVRRSDKWLIVENAEAALRRLGGGYLAAARRQRAADERALSLARPEARADRGLSRVKGEK